jgi:NitT/TauT family transport system substrate-binding protein
MVFTVEPHMRLQEWVAEERGFFAAEGLEYVDVRRFGPGERVVPQPYTREMFERTQGWMREWGLLDLTDPDGARYEETVLA